MKPLQLMHTLRIHIQHAQVLHASHPCATLLEACALFYRLSTSRPGSLRNIQHRATWPPERYALDSKRTQSYQAEAVPRFFSLQASPFGQRVRPGGETLCRAPAHAAQRNASCTSQAPAHACSLPWHRQRAIPGVSDHTLIQAQVRAHTHPAGQILLQWPCGRPQHHIAAAARTPAGH